LQNYPRHDWRRTHTQKKSAWNKTLPEIKKKLTAKQQEIYRFLKALLHYRQDSIFYLLFACEAYPTAAEFISDWELYGNNSNLANFNSIAKQMQNCNPLELLQATVGLQAYRNAVQRLQSAQPLTYKILHGLADAEAYGAPTVERIADSYGITRQRYYRSIDSGLAYIARQLAE